MGKECNVPGSTGVPLLSDQTLAFWREPLEFCRKRTEKHGSVFQTRLLNHGTIVVCDYGTAREVLALPEEAASASEAYDDLFHDVFGEESILLTTHNREHIRLKSCLLTWLAPSNIEALDPLLTNVAARTVRLLQEACSLA